MSERLLPRYAGPIWNGARRAHLPLWLALVLAVLLFARAAPALAASCSVPSLTHHTIQLALNDSACAVIHITAGTYHEHNLRLARNVKLIGVGYKTTIIDGQNAAPVFVFAVGSYGVTIRGVTIEHGNAASTSSGSGGGIFMNMPESDTTSSLTVKNSEFLDNHAQRGGAIYANPMPDEGVSPTSMHLILQNVLFSGNTTTAEGGAVWTSATTTIEHSTFTNNSSGSDGGALYLPDAGGYPNEDISITQVAFFKNTAQRGAAIADLTGYSGSLTLSSSTLHHNTAAVEGGALLSGTRTSITNSTFSQNTAQSGSGGAIYADSTLPDLSVTLLNDTFHANVAGATGGSLAAGIYAGGSAHSDKYTVANTILNRGNPNNCASPATSLLTSNGSNLSSDTSCAAAFTAPFDQNHTNPMLLKLAANGGFTGTHALKAGSPAIDAVLNACPPPATDQRGVARPQNGNGFVARCDIGAYEYQPPTAH